MRLNKFLAHARLSSRRMAEQIITDGEITINGRICLDPATQVDPHNDHIRCGTKKLSLRTHKIYLAVNKPAGYVCTNHDPYANKIIFDLIPYKKEKLFTIGRLDKDSEGLILISNDGELNQTLTQNKKIQKKYRVWVDGKVYKSQITKIDNQSIKIKNITYSMKEVSIGKKTQYGAIINFTLEEGKNRQIRKICEHFNWKVKRLKRTSIGALEIKEMPTSCYKELTKKEIEELFKL